MASNRGIAHLSIRHRYTVLPASLAMLIVAGAGCTSGSDNPQTSTPASGGSTASGGGSIGGSQSNGGSSGGATTRTGGAPSTGGTTVNPTGGAPPTGGTTGAGGANTRWTGTGGVVTTGGTVATGGVTASGGRSGVGGVTSTGGVNITGGVTNTGAASGAGGVAVTGGTTGVGGAGGAGGRAAGGSGGRGVAGGIPGGTGGGNNGGASGAYCPTTPGTACNVMPVGDSITEGCCTAPMGGYRIELYHQALTNNKNITFVGTLTNGPSTVDGKPFPQHHEGHGGWKIAQIAGVIDNAISSSKPHIVLLKIGTNDINGNDDVNNAPNRLASLIDQITKDAPAALLVVSAIIPTTTDSKNPKMQTYNTAIKAKAEAAAAAGKHVVFVDNYKAFTDNANFKTALMADELHPNSAGYVVLGDSFYGMISSYLQAP
jgi:lysophospholipase L1-like esterase